jgi:AhpD family alkylhydroperoxidase
VARIAIPNKETAPARAEAILDRYARNLGVTPNFSSLIARSPDVLNAEANIHAGPGNILGHDTRERIHIMAAEVNGCDSCLSVDTYVAGKFNHRSKEETELNREGHSTDPRADTAVQFAYLVAKNRGRLRDADLEAVRAVEFRDEEMIDIVAETAFSFTTNLFHNTFQTAIDAIVPPLETHYNQHAAH